MAGVSAAPCALLYILVLVALQNFGRAVAAQPGHLVRHEQRGRVKSTVSPSGELEGAGDPGSRSMGDNTMLGVAEAEAADDAEEGQLDMDNEWFGVLGDPGQSCTSACAAKRWRCQVLSYGNNGFNDDVVRKLAVSAGVPCETTTKTCPNQESCQEQGAPYLDKSLVHPATCFTGDAASCDQKPFNLNHRRLCYCLPVA
eukprot:gb/GFBE01005221.1/.p1 GENE.gb/GFBE01005221.1/~~gb/GFBE01005221.1/.p1  ORF type:complete len:199 (+),score=32.01 gb/GFBE01005221.1/:1-597(+)